MHRDVSHFLPLLSQTKQHAAEQRAVIRAQAMYCWPVVRHLFFNSWVGQSDRQLRNAADNDAEEFPRYWRNANVAAV